MNCKKGDLAIVVRSYAGNEGCIVRCIKLVGDDCWYGPDGIREIIPTWEVDVSLPDFAGEKAPYIPDDQLRPLRDSDGEDEILRIAGYPNKEIA